MGNFIRYYALLARRWMWMFVVCTIVCSSATYLISSFLSPVYQASAYLVINVGASAHPSVSDSLQAVPTFAQLITIPTVINPVVAQHAGLSSQDLLSMMSVKPQTNTQIIELDVQATGAQLAANLANQVGQSFARYANASAPGTVQIIPASAPTFPAQPRPLQDAGIGALVGLLLAVLLMVLFEWISNRPTSVEQIQKLLDTEILTLLPPFSLRNRQAVAEKYRMVCASLDMAQADRPFKLVMFTSALAGEGKSTVASNVAIHLAQAGKQVLLIDLNIHRPALAREFRLPERAGLTNVLARNGNVQLVEGYVQATSWPSLSLLLAGTRRMNSAELLRTLTATQLLPQLQRSSFDYVLFDAPPLLAVAEAQVLASSMEALVLVVDSLRTPCKALVRVRQLLWRIPSSRVLGVVVNHSAWRDYTDTHPYTPPQLEARQNEPQLPVEEIRRESPQVVASGLPIAPMEFISAPPTGGKMGEPHWPDTGKSECVARPFPDRVIRPGLSLNGLSVSGHGLVRRSFNKADSVPATPESL